MKYGKRLITATGVSLLALQFNAGLASAQAISASAPFNGNYVGTTSGGCSPGYPVNVGDVINWMAINNGASQSTFIPDPSQSYSNWLSGLTLSVVSPFTAIVTPAANETPIEWGIVKRSVVYGANSAVGKFDTVVPPKSPDAVYNVSQKFIVTSYPFPDGSGTGYYVYFYIPPMTNFFKYGAVFNQTSGQASSAAGVFQGNFNGCTFSFTYTQ